MTLYMIRGWQNETEQEFVADLKNDQEAQRLVDRLNTLKDDYGTCGWGFYALEPTNVTHLLLSNHSVAWEVTKHPPFGDRYSARLIVDPLVPQDDPRLPFITHVVALSREEAIEYAKPILDERWNDEDYAEMQQMVTAMRNRTPIHNERKLP